MRPSPAQQAGAEGRLTPAQLARELCRGKAPPGGLSDQDLAAAGLQRPPPPVRLHPRQPEPQSDLPVTGPGLGQLQPHPLPPGTLRSGQPAAIAVPHNTGIRRSARHDQRALTSALKAVRETLAALSLALRRGSRCGSCLCAEPAPRPL